MYFNNCWLPLTPVILFEYLVKDAKITQHVTIARIKEEKVYVHTKAVIIARPRHFWSFAAFKSQINLKEPVILYEY